MSTSGESGDDTLGWALSAEAAQLYLVLLSSGSAGTERDVSSFDRLTVDEVIASGFAVRDPVHGGLVALPPEVPIVRKLAALTHRWMAGVPDVAAAERDLQNLVRRDVRTLQFGSTTTGSPTRLVDELVTREERSVAANATMINARSELCIMQSDLGMRDDDNHDPEQVALVPSDLLERGVRIRFLYERNVLDDEEFLRAALEEVDMGVEARVAETLTADAVIVDRSLVLIMQCDRNRAALMTTVGPVVATVQYAFETAWATAVPLGLGSKKSNQHDLSELHKMILSSVLAGRPNDAIGRTLKIDPRTVRRKVDDLCDYFGVDSRNALISAALATLRD